MAPRGMVRPIKHEAFSANCISSRFERYNRSLLKLMSSSTKMSSLNLLIARGRILMGWSVDHPWGGGISEALMPIANPPVR